jgi:hypothetical protein
MDNKGIMSIRFWLFGDLLWRIEDWTTTRAAHVRTFDIDELQHATIKCMRGLLFAMMRQSHKVETFKGTQALDQSLHAK